MKTVTKPYPFYLSGVVILLSLLFVFPAYSQSTVSGVVRIAGEPMRYVKIQLVGSKHRAVTDSAGTFVLKSVAKGSYTLRASLTGFETFDTLLVMQDEPIRLSIALSEKNIFTDEVVVTGTMKEVSRSASPVSIEVYSSEMFKKNPTPSLFESVGMINGVRPQLNCNVCNTGDIHINGMEGPYTMVTIDGMPIVSSLSTVYGLSGIPQSVIRRIEVVKGPASTLYGSEAVGGLINVITKEPSASPSAALEMTASSYSEFSGDLSTTARISDDVTTLISASYFHFDKQWDINADNFTDIPLQKRVSVFNKWSFLNNQGGSDNIGARYVYEDRWGGERQWTRQFRGSDSVYGESIYTRRLELLGSYQLPIPSQLLTLQYSFNTHEQDSRYGTMSYVASQRIAFGQLLWDMRIGTMHDMLIGAAMRYTYYDDNTPGTQAASNTYLPGIFVQDEIQLSPEHILLAGLRYDYNTSHGNIFTPRLNYKYMLDANNTFRLGLGTGYRIVNLFTEDHAALTGSREVVITEDLRPERSYNASVNYATNIIRDFGYVGIDASLFYTYFTNKITGDYSIDPNLIIYDNLNGYAVCGGFTLNTELSTTSGFKVHAGLTWMDVYQVERTASGAEHRTPQLFAPKLSGTWSVSQQLPALRLTVDWTGTVQSRMYLPTQPNDYRPDFSPWFALTNLQATYAVNEGVEVYGVIKNLLDFIPEYSLMRPFDPFDKRIGTNNPNGWTFDTGYNYAPIQGIRFLLGMRWTLD